MAYIEWNDDLSIGVQMFDDEHKELVDILNTLHDGIVHDIDRLNLREIGVKLVEFTVLHFRHEEMYFEDFAYPKAEVHTAQHAAIKEQMLAYYERICAEHHPELSIELLDFVRDWLCMHIATADAELGKYLQAHGYAARRKHRTFAERL